MPKNLQVFNNSLENPDGRPWHALSLTIGNFDGCHLGHQSLIRKAIELAQENNKTHAAAMSFSPRPEAFFRNLDPELLLFTPAQKTRAFQELGLDYHILQKFDASFSQLSHDLFYDKVLKESLNAAAIVVGENFRFGNGRKGDTKFLLHSASRDHTRVEIMPPSMHADEIISSTRIRQSLADGHVAAAAVMLGRPFRVDGVIQRGDQLGRQLGVPTANLEGIQQLLPRFGIYAGYVHLGSDGQLLQLDKRAIPAVFSLGIRPTLQAANPPVRVEAHLLTGHYALDALYGQNSSYYLTEWLRGEESFPNLESLKKQMAKDIALAKQHTGIN